MALTKKKILLFTDWYEPGFKAGGPIQSCRNIVNLLSGDATFYIVTSDRDLGDTQAYPGIQTDTWLSKGNINLFYSSPRAMTLNNILEMFRLLNPDVVYLNSMFSFRYTIIPLWAIRKSGFRKRVVLAPRGMLAHSALAMKRWKKRPFLFAFSNSQLSKRMVFHATNQQEITDIRKVMGPKANIVYAANVPQVPNSVPEKEKREGQLNCLYLSRIHPIKNLAFALEVFNGIKDLRNIRFDIFGPVEDEQYYAKCFALARQLEENVEVNFMGPLDHGHLADTFKDYHLFFLPTKGENFGHAIFEALACGCPVLISDQTPWTDLEANNAGWSISLDEEEEFRKKIREMYQLDHLAMREKSHAAYEYASKYVSSANLKKNYSTLFGLEVNEASDAHPRA
jgi:glycosyltransferase involved in cell wall biosynthesis